jgi:nucleotide-binding universal stress UspA family protein
MQPSYGGAMQTLDRHSATTPVSLFGPIACVIDSAPGGAEAVRQATALAGADGSLDLVAVAPAPAPGRRQPLAAQAEALGKASAVAAQAGVHTTIHIEETSDEPAAVLELCHDHALLVLPPGPLADAVLPRATVPVLVARPGPDGGDFPGSMLIAVDGTPEAHAAARLGARLAARRQAVPALVASPEHDAAHQSGLQQDAAMVERITGRRPLILDEHGAPAASIIAAAQSLEASLILLGSRPGRPVASVSAKVAARAPCSVLVLRPGPAVSAPLSAQT